ncbi:MlaD family protein [Synechococcus sp. CBW1004]|uniref:MlaD family protein n=1 Tax=Synechococcus sp. CBW1004 TaxID=1353136 RepID=UPI0018CF82BE|nr:MlaD family protein [Synechococcus sp. CBW1004]QPN62698.1 MCE family protein [Synechococcus sp. CBW1004]
MRRSVREALVGFSLLAAISGGFGLWLWLRGVSIGRSTWTVTASFADASGLAERSPVSYRGVLVGSVRSVKITNRAVLAELEITDPSLRLSRPVVAQVGTSSLLGGDAQVALLSSGPPLPESSPGPRDRGCDSRRMLCQNGQVPGVATASLQTVTDTVQKLLDQADRDKLVEKMVAATASFEATAREAEKLSKEGQVFVAEANRLVGTLNRSAGKIDPILSNANRASVDVAQASRHIRNLSAALDNPRTVADLQATLTNAKQLTDRWSAVGGDVRKLTDDPRFMDGIRSVSVGLGRFFEELYPAQTAAARERDERRRAERQRAVDSAGSGPAAGAASASP